MISKSKISWLRSLQQKKFRDLEKVFLVEGEKGILEGFRSTLKCEALFASKSFLEQFESSINEEIQVFEASQNDLEKAGYFQTNSAAIAVFGQHDQPLKIDLNIGAHIYLDQVKDPGNLGTIVRLADWFGLDHILLSPGCVDFYNSKTIASTMGSFSRIWPVTMNAQDIGKFTKTKLVGAGMQGSDIHNFVFPDHFILIMGSESQGLSEQVTFNLDEKITIPRYGKAESLNVAMATAICLDNWKRQKTK